MQPTTARPMPATTIYADTETIPTQRLDILAELTEASNEERDAKIAALAPPKNIKKAETIAAWIENELPAKREEISAAYAVSLAESIHKTGLDGAFGHLVVISLAANDEDPISLWDPHWDAPGYEAWLLHQLDAAMRARCKHHRGQMLVGHNISFDRRMIRQRGIVLGVPVHPIFTKEVKPWETDSVYDTMLAWTGDHRLYVTMDKLCKALGLAGKGSDLDDGEYIDGSQVWEFVQRGEIGKVAKYCGGDVRRTRDLFKILSGLTPRPPQPIFVPTPLDDAPVVPTPLAIDCDPGIRVVIGGETAGYIDRAEAGADTTSVAVIDGNGVTFVDSEFPPATDEAPALAAEELPDNF